jgi:hypothetical protein
MKIYAIKNTFLRRISIILVIVPIVLGVSFIVIPIISTTSAIKEAFSTAFKASEKLLDIISEAKDCWGGG